MLRNRLLFIFLIILLSTFVYLDGSPITYTGLYALFILALLSIFITFVSMRKLNIELVIDEFIVHKKEIINVDVIVKNPSIFSRPLIKVTIAHHPIGVQMKKNSAYFSLSSNSRHRQRFKVTCIYRGVYHFDLKEVILFDYLGLVKFKKKGKHQPVELIIRPDISPVIKYKLPNIFAIDNENTKKSHESRLDEVSHLRQFEQGDRIRQIHWKATAKRQTFISKVHETKAALHVNLIVDNRHLTPSTVKAFEDEDRLMSVVASLANHYLSAQMPLAYMTHHNHYVPLTLDVHQLQLEIAKTCFFYDHKLLNQAPLFPKIATLNGLTFIFTIKLDPLLLKDLQTINHKFVFVFTVEKIEEELLVQLKKQGIQCIQEV